MNAAREFIGIYRMYRRYHPRRYALATAWRIAIGNQPF